MVRSVSKIILPDPDYETDDRAQDGFDNDDDYDGTNPITPDPDYEEPRPLGYFVDDFRPHKTENRENALQQPEWVKPVSEPAPLAENFPRPKFSPSEGRGFIPFRSVKNNSSTAIDYGQNQSPGRYPAVFPEERRRRSSVDVSPLPRSPTSPRLRQRSPEYSPMSSPNFARRLSPRHRALQSPEAQSPRGLPRSSATKDRFVTDYYSTNNFGTGRYRSRFRKSADFDGPPFGRPRLSSASSLAAYGSSNLNQRLLNGHFDNFESTSLHDYSQSRPRLHSGESEARVRAPALYNEAVTSPREEVPAPTVNGNIENSNTVRVATPYTARNTEELSVKPGEQLQVIEKRVVWWKCKSAFNETGWIPARHLYLIPEEKKSH